MQRKPLFKSKEEKYSEDDSPSVPLRLSRFPRSMMRDNEIMLSPVIQFSSSENKEDEFSPIAVSTPTVWIFLIDISGSMDEHNKLNTVKALLANILSSELIKEKDTIELITFNVKAESIYRGPKIAQAGMAELVRPLKASQGTSFVPPFAIINPSHYKKNHKIAVIGLTDGLPSAASELDGVEIRRQFNEKFLKAGYLENPQIVFMGVGPDCDVTKIEKFHQPVTVPVYAEHTGAMMRAFREAMAEKNKAYVEIAWEFKTQVKIHSAPLEIAEAKGVFLGAPFITDADELKNSGTIEYCAKIGKRNISSRGKFVPSSLQAIPVDYQATYLYFIQRLLRIQEFEVIDLGVEKPIKKKNSLEALKAEIFAIMEEEGALNFKKQFDYLLGQIEETLKGFGGDQASFNKARLATTLGKVAVATEYDQNLLTGAQFVPIETKPRENHLGKDKVNYQLSGWRCPWSDQAAANLTELTDRPMAFPHPDPSYKNRVLILINPSELKQYGKSEFKNIEEIIHYVKDQVPLEPISDKAEIGLKKFCTVVSSRYIIPNEIPLGAFFEKKQGDPFIQTLCCYYLLLVNIKNGSLPDGSLEFYQARSDATPLLVSRFLISYRPRKGPLYLIDPGNNEEHQIVNVMEKEQRKKLISYYETALHLPGVLRIILSTLDCNDHPGFVNFPPKLFIIPHYDFYRKTVGIPEYLICPLSGSLMQSPVFFKENTKHAFDKASAEKWIALYKKKSGLKHPVTGEPISDELVPDQQKIVRVKYILQGCAYYRLNEEDIVIVTKETRTIFETAEPRAEFTIKTGKDLQRIQKEKEDGFTTKKSLSTPIPFVLKAGKGILVQPSSSDSYSSSSSSSVYTSSSSSSILSSISGLPFPTDRVKTMTREEVAMLREQLKEKKTETRPVQPLGLGTEHLSKVTIFSPPQQTQRIEPPVKDQDKVRTSEDYKLALKKAQEGRRTRMAGGK